MLKSPAKQLKNRIVGLSSFIFCQRWDYIFLNALRQIKKSVIITFIKDFGEEKWLLTEQ